MMTLRHFFHCDTAKLTYHTYNTITRLKMKECAAFKHETYVCVLWASAAADTRRDNRLTKDHQA